MSDPVTDSSHDECLCLQTQHCIAFEICRISRQNKFVELVHLVGFITKKLHSLFTFIHFIMKASFVKI
jgi:hypothetical protein